MDITVGFQIEEPNVFVRWGIPDSELKGLLKKSLKKIGDGYFTIKCRSMGGLEHYLGFHFYPRNDGILTELEIFFAPNSDLEQTYIESRKHLNSTFGNASVNKMGSGIYEKFEHDWQEWHMGNVIISHFCQYRFGSEQILRIKNAS